MRIEDKVHKQCKYESMNGMVEYYENAYVEKFRHQLLLSGLCATVTNVMSKEYTTEDLALKRL